MPDSFLRAWDGISFLSIQLTNSGLGIERKGQRKNPLRQCTALVAGENPRGQEAAKDSAQFSASTMEALYPRVPILCGNCNSFLTGLVFLILTMSLVPPQFSSPSSLGFLEFQ